jgi:lipid-A-disaccharide synthase
MGWLTVAIARRFIKARYAALVNLMLDREAVPEFMQEKCEPEALALALKTLLLDPGARTAQLRELEEAVRGFGLGQERPSIRAARAVLKLASGE